MSISEKAIPLMPRGVRLHHDKVRDRWVLLAPERAINLDSVGYAILLEIDGKKTFGDIAARLTEVYAAPAKQIAADVGDYIQGLVNRRILDLAP